MTLTVPALGEALTLPESYLRELGLTDSTDGVAMPYYTADGMLVASKLRLALEGPRRFRWPTGLPLLPYGLWRLDLARRHGQLILVEGESDCWALWHHGLPALGLPGSNATACLESEALECITTLYLHREPDKGGDAFVAGCQRRLRQLGYTGTVRELRMPAGIKDPAALHRDSPDRFVARLEPCLRSAPALTPRDPPRPSANGVNGHATNGTPCPAAINEPLELPLPPAVDYPAPILDAAWYGLAGQIVQLLAPQTEADPVAILVQMLAAYGSVIGRHAYWEVDAVRHYGTLYLALVGDTSLGRKGTSLARALSPFSALSDTWLSERIVSGLSSGEGLIWAVRDAIYGTHQIKQRGRVMDTQSVVTDRGVSDKRLFVLETELARPFFAMRREANTLSPVLRQAWESGNLSTMTRTSAARATGAHISLIGHITRSELGRALAVSELSNGLGNRFLWLASRRTRLLPLGGEPVDLGHLPLKLAYAVEQAQLAGEIGLDAEAEALYRGDVYPRLNEPAQGIRGGLLARGPAQVRRLAMLYALLDFSDLVRLPHLLAALAIWDYCERSVEWIFQDATASSPNEQEILAALSSVPDGLSRTQINRLAFYGKLAATDLTAALLALRSQGLITEETTHANGRKLIKYVPTLSALARSGALSPNGQTP